MATQTVGTDTAARILDVTERLVQQRGFNAFSYADVAGELGITTASLHYHFASKASLGLAVVDRYTGRFQSALDELDRGAPDAAAKLVGYTRLYAEVLRQHRMCLCGMLAADYLTLPEPMRSAVLDFFQRNEKWLTAVLDQGAEDGSLQTTESTASAASTMIGAIEGAMLVARAFDDVERFERTADVILASLTR
ncbi:TetR/AcrR family transcriptional regulator [Rathayibacter soli]|uniref:TetR/AcrR family transcriptional regulator n=1 Tax=Rathayibacter soli TaxID=3144168 RepID=UPI0027E3E142|nr:TetR/AcrR family transcriptional regulator [Glaciibacter superstes]